MCIITFSHLTKVTLTAILQTSAKISQHMDQLLFAMPLISCLPLEFPEVVDVVKVIIEFGIFRSRAFVSVGDQCLREAYAPFGKGLEIIVGRSYTTCHAGSARTCRARWGCAVGSGATGTASTKDGGQLPPSGRLAAISSVASVIASVVVIVTRRKGLASHRPQIFILLVFIVVVVVVVVIVLYIKEAAGRERNVGGEQITRLRVSADAPALLDFPLPMLPSQSDCFHDNLPDLFVLPPVEAAAPTSFPMEVVVAAPASLPEADETWPEFPFAPVAVAF